MSDQGASVLDNNTFAEQEYYYEDGCLYIANKTGCGILNVNALYPQLINSFSEDGVKEEPCKPNAS